VALCDALPGSRRRRDGRCRGRVVRHRRAGGVDRRPLRHERLRGRAGHVRGSVRRTDRRPRLHDPRDLGRAAHREGQSAARRDARTRGAGRGGHRRHRWRGDRPAASHRRYLLQRGATDARVRAAGAGEHATARPRGGPRRATHRQEHRRQLLLRPLAADRGRSPGDRRRRAAQPEDVVPAARGDPAGPADTALQARLVLESGVRARVRGVARSGLRRRPGADTPRAAPANDPVQLRHRVSR